jgi:hypothetical protein
MNQRENWQSTVIRPFPREPDFECDPQPKHPQYRLRHEIIDQMDVGPDAWCMAQRLVHPDIANNQDFLDKIRTCEAWAYYLNVSSKTLLTIRNRTNALTKTLETGGPIVSASEIKNYANFVYQNWPTKVPRDENDNKVVPSGEREAKVITTYGIIIEEDLSAATKMVGLQKWVTRRTKFKTFSKFANILNDFSRELGPPFFGVMKALQLKLDLILSMRRYTINGPRAIHNDYTNNFYDWMREMFSVDEVNKKVNGQIVQISHQKMLISEEEFMTLCEKREQM